MEKLIEAICPLCSSEATYIGVDYGRRKSFSCQNCSSFQISLGAEKRLAKAPKSWKDACSQKAKNTPDGKLLLIVLPDMNKKDGGTSEALTAKYYLKSDLP